MKVALQIFKEDATDARTSARWGGLKIVQNKYIRGIFPFMETTQAEIMAKPPSLPYSL